jgi:hypothetical protein
MHTMRSCLVPPPSELACSHFNCYGFEHHVMYADNRLRLIQKHLIGPDGTDRGADWTHEQKAAVVLESADARDFLLKAADINNIKTKYVDCLWKRAERDVESVYLWVRFIHIHVHAECAWHMAGDILDDSLAGYHTGMVFPLHAHAELQHNPVDNLGTAQATRSAQPPSVVPW